VTIPHSVASDLFGLVRATHALVVTLHKRVDQLEKIIMSAQDDFKTAEAQMLAALKADLASRAQAISDAVAKAQAAWEANDEAKWAEAAQDMKDASAAIQAAGGGGFTPSGNVPAGG
jgi:peptidoglycan hydrolase CwlO-like protein